MNFKNQHVKDELIEHELEGLRKMVPSDEGMLRAMQAMRQPVPSKRPYLLAWPLGITSAAAMAFAVVVIVSGSSANAFASDLRAISKAQKEQKTMHERSWMYRNGTILERTTDLWIDHSKEAFLEHAPDGGLVSASICDGSQRFLYYAGFPRVGLQREASVDQGSFSHFEIGTITGYLTSDWFMKHSIEKKTGVLLNGRTCDYYSFAKGYQRLWVDPTTKLVIQREVYDRGVTLGERDTYEYPAQLAASTFQPIKVPGVQTCNYIEKRKQLSRKLASAGQTDKVGSVKINLKEVVADRNVVIPIWTASSPQGNAVPMASVMCEGIKGQGQPTTVINALPDNLTEGVQVDSEYTKQPINPKDPLIIKIAVWDRPQSGAKSSGKIIGWSRFKVADAIFVTHASNLIGKHGTGVGVAVAKDKSTK